MHKLLLSIFTVFITIKGGAVENNQQSPGHFGGFISDDAVFTVADDFQFAQDTLVGGCTWWGGYFNSPPGPDNFTVRVYADSSGHPGTLLSGFTVGVIAKTATGDFVYSPGMYPEYRYSTSLESPFLAQAGVRYWLSIVNPPQDIWLWEASGNPLNPGMQRSFNGEPWQSYSYNMAFQLVAVPEPRSMFLVATGIAGILCLSCKRKKLRV